MPSHATRSARSRIAVGRGRSDAPRRVSDERERKRGPWLDAETQPVDDVARRRRRSASQHVTDTRRSLSAVEQRARRCQNA